MFKSSAQAHSMIRIAALVVGGTYAYRRFTEGTAEELKASTKIAPIGQFVIAWGVVFFGLSLIAGPLPTLAGNMAILVMLASLLANGVQISKDLKTGMQRSLKEREALAHPHQAPHRGSGTAGTVLPETRSA